MQSFKSVWSLTLFITLGAGGVSVLQAAERNEGAGDGRKDVPATDADSSSASRVGPGRLAPARTAPVQSPEKSSGKPAATPHGGTEGESGKKIPSREVIPSREATPAKDGTPSRDSTPSRVIEERDILWDTEFYVFAPVGREGVVRWPVKFSEMYVTNTSRTRKHF